MADGHLNKCKSCTRDDVKRNRESKREYYIAYDRMRYDTNQERRNRPKRKGARVRDGSEERRRYAPKIRARAIAYRALKNGEIARPSVCPRCNRHADEVGVMQMHHRDYGLPLDVQWVCASCHGFLHRKPRTCRFSVNQFNLDKPLTPNGLGDAVNRSWRTYNQ